MQRGQVNARSDDDEHNENDDRSSRMRLRSAANTLVRSVELLMNGGNLMDHTPLVISDSDSDDGPSTSAAAAQRSAAAIATSPSAVAPAEQPGVNAVAQQPGVNIADEQPVVNATAQQPGVNTAAQQLTRVHAIRPYVVPQPQIVRSISSNQGRASIRETDEDGMVNIFPLGEFDQMFANYLLRNPQSDYSSSESDDDINIIISNGNLNNNPNAQVRQDMPIPAIAAEASTPAPENVDLGTNDEVEVKTNATSPSAKKRKLSPAEPVPVPVQRPDDSDDGTQCPICMDDWEISGEHRLISLKCGHLYGDSCIRRWFRESGPSAMTKCCPQCKVKSNTRHIRYLYAKRLRVIDRTVEQDLRDMVEKEKKTKDDLQSSLSSLKMSFSLLNQRTEELDEENKRLRNILRSSGLEHLAEADNRAFTIQPFYKLHLDHTIDIARESGCRVMIYADQPNTLVASQRSMQGMLFAGYGIRFIDVSTLRPISFAYTSSKLIRDICLNSTQKLISVASQESRVKLFEFRSTSPIGSVTLSQNRMIWSCNMGTSTRDNNIYLGTNNGSTYVYDIRYLSEALEEHKIDKEISPIINIKDIPSSPSSPYGGFLVSNFQSVWFFEYTGSSADGSNIVTPTRLFHDGPVVSMDYNSEHSSILVSTRASSQQPMSRYIYGNMSSIDGVPVVTNKTIFFGSKASPIMTRNAQIHIGSNVLISGYIQDEKMLALYDVARQSRVQSLPVANTIFDVCPIINSRDKYLAALTDSKCRIYKINART